jgi:hypothetical protein
MLYSFHLYNEHQDEQLATESPPLPKDDIEAIELALEKRSGALLQRVKTRAGNIEGNVKGKTALMRAVLKDHAEEVQLLLAAGADVNAKDRSGETVLQMAVRSGKLAALQQLLHSENISAKTRKEVLKSTLKNKKVDAFVMLTKSFAVSDSIVKDCIAEYLYYAIHKQDLISIDKILSIPDVDVTRASHKGHSSVHWAIKKGNLAAVIKLLEKAKLLFQIPLSAMLKDFSHFDSVEKCRDLYYSKDPISYLDSFNLCDPVTVYALRILQAEKDALEYDKRLVNNKESAMDDKEVSLANQHFIEKVKPHFAEKFVAMGGLAEIEKGIRKLILKAIKEDAQNPINQRLIDFIKAKKVALVNADPKALQESLNYFTLSTISHAAWRGYNPSAKTKEWSNLLTRPEKDSKIFTTKASGDLTSFAASDLVRERIAYYYLAVIDKTDGDEATRRNRIGNFIGLLEAIRNEHGRDDPSCFPGHITRIAQMGLFHSVAEQPVKTKTEVAAFFKSKVFEVFKAKTAELSAEVVQQLLRALVDLNHLTAKDMTLAPTEYSPELLRVRQKFTEILGNEFTLFDTFKQTTHLLVDDEDLIYFTQHLLDITRGDIASSLEDYVRRITDRPTLLEDLEALNTFDEKEPRAAALFADLLTFVHQNVPHYSKSFQQLQGFAECAAYKVRQILDQPENCKQYLQALVELMGLEDDDKQFTLQAIERILATHSIVIQVKRVVNPFEVQCKQLEQTIMLTRNPAMIVQLKKRLTTLQQKTELFRHFERYLTESDLEHEQQEMLIYITKSAVEYSIHHNAFEVASFKESLKEEGELPLEDAIFDDVTNKLYDFFPSKYITDVVNPSRRCKV